MQTLFTSLKMDSTGEVSRLILIMDMDMDTKQGQAGLGQDDEE